MRATKFSFRRLPLYFLFLFMASPSSVQTSPSDLPDLVEFSEDPLLSSTPEIAANGSLTGWSLFHTEEGDRYIINFKEIAIAEYLRFVSKISGINFQFEETALNFTITIVSEEPLGIQNILSSLIQTLRARGFSVLEQGKNLFITTSREINQIPTIVTAETPKKEGRSSPIVTRIFRIKNANLSSIASIIKPMMSVTAMIEVSNETRQLIVTDITTNVDQIATLLESLDSPHSPLEIDTYRGRYLGASQLIELTRQIVGPFAEGTTLILVPQEATNSIFIVSTPNLIERAIEVMEDLDAHPKGIQGPMGNQILLYPIVHRSPDELLDAVEEIAEQLKSGGAQSIKLVSALENGRWIKDSNSLLFITDLETQVKILEIVKTLDVSSETSSYWLYTPQYLNGKELEKAIVELQQNFTSSGLADATLMKAIRSMRWVPATNTLLFTGAPEALTHIQGIIHSIDVPSGAQTNIFLYRPKSLTSGQIEEAFDELADKLDLKNLNDRNLATAIDGMAWIAESQTFLFKADPNSIEKIELFLKGIDLPLSTTGSSGSSRGSIESEFFIYKPLYLSPEELATALKQTAVDLRASGLIDPNLLSTIETMRVVSLTKSIVFTGTSLSLEKAKTIIATLDVPGGTGDNSSTTDHQMFTTDGEKKGFLIYRLRYISLDRFASEMKVFIAHLQGERPQNLPLIAALQKGKPIKESNSILFTAPSAVLEEIEILMKQIDVPNNATTSNGEDFSAKIKESYVVYKPINVSGPELIELAKDFMQHLKQSGIQEAPFFETIDHLSYVQKTGYILISGETAAVGKVEELLHKFDVPSAATVTSLPQMNTSFLIYKLQYHPGDAIQTTLKNIGQDFATSTNKAHDGNLVTAINSIQWIKLTNSLLATGSPSTLTQLKELIQNVDVPLRQVFIEVLIIKTTMSNNQQFGLQWGNKVQYLDRFAGGFGNFPSPNLAGAANQVLAPPLGVISATRTPLASDIPVPTGTTGGFDLGVIGDIILHKGKSFISLGSLVNALEQDNNSLIVMNPKIVAQDNQQSTIFVGQNIPFVGSQITTTQGGTASTQTASNIEYRDVGTNLTITPILGTSDIVTLDISNEITAQVENTTSGLEGLQGLQTSRTALTTRVHVPNKHFVALSGLLQDTKTKFRSGIPCLGGLPVIGAFFSENDRFASRDNILFFIRPVIVDSIEEYERITQNQEVVLKELGEKQIVKEEIDDAIDRIVCPPCG